MFLFSMGMMHLFTQLYLPWNETRPGYPVNDVVLRYLPRFDCSKWITLVEFTVCFLTALDSFYYHHPSRYELLWLKFTCISYMKMITTFLLPLEPPTGLINLADPIVERLLLFHTKPLKKDLFFSGHTSMMVLCLLHVTNPHLVPVFTLAVLLMSVMLLHNHIHYSIDVFISLFVVFTIHTLMDRIADSTTLMDTYVVYFYPFSE